MVFFITLCPLFLDAKNNDLEIQEAKTKIIKFGRFAVNECKKAGIKKPETFDFLGFTHYCSKGKNGCFRVKRNL
ncbi:MAG: hypothetical protein APF81_04085 [Desulfosporosinus sp. BRH_c37]|nr:MAG: hypothetical protein APF81_04085 [Desulfosporosinus sp. BRH_c37]